MRRPRPLPLPHDDADALRGFAEADDPDLDTLLRAGPHLQALFRIPDPQAPRLHVVGAVFAVFGRPFSATGAGLTPRAALAGCLGEAVETLSQAARPGEADAPIRAARLSDGAARAFPAARILRLPGAPPGGSLGCAAGPSLEAATRAAAREISERDALARAAPRPPCAAARAAARDMLAAAGRLGQPPRLSAFDDARGMVTILAQSETAQGAAADPDPATAARRAALELCAAEAGAALSGAPAPPIAPQAAEGDLWAVDLTRAEFGAPVVKLIAAGLSTG